LRQGMPNGCTHHHYRIHRFAVLGPFPYLMEIPMAITMSPRPDPTTAKANLVRVHRARVYPQTLNEQPQDNRVDAVADENTIERLTGARCRVDYHEDVDEGPGAACNT
jgi:hypothetical protein